MVKRRATLPIAGRNTFTSSRHAAASPPAVATTKSRSWSADSRELGTRYLQDIRVIAAAESGSLILARPRRRAVRECTLASALVDPSARLDPERVAQYAAPRLGFPVVVYDTPEGRLLVDGYHRIAAAQQRGASTIEAEIRHGSRRDALHYAAAKAAVQRDMSFDEAVGHIKRRSGDLRGGHWGATSTVPSRPTMSTPASAREPRFGQPL
jgi:hypothetical protein